MTIPRATEKDGPLEGHVRKGRVYRSPFAASRLLEFADWTKDDLPDLLWPVLLLSIEGTDSAHGFIKWQKAVQGDLADYADGGFIAECLDGRLTGLERLTARVPEAVESVCRRAREAGLLPGEVARVLAAYPSRPAVWLLDADSPGLSARDVEVLTQALFDVLADGHREAIIKCLSIWSAVQAGTFSTSAETVDLLRRYPADLDTRDSADGAIRAMWGAQRSARLYKDPAHFDEAARWAREFWNANSRMTPCRRTRDRAPATSDVAEQGVEQEPEVALSEPDRGRHPAAPTLMPDGGAELRERAMRLFSSYVQALEVSPADLYNPARQEVHSGLVSRIARDIIAVLGAPDLWCMEHGAHIHRGVIEAHIHLQWMSMQGESIYETYQNYGRGKAKLYARILNELPTDVRPSGFDEGIAGLEKLSRNDDIFDSRVVDTRDSFAEGTSLRAMAAACGLLELYRSAYAISSGVTHSEWWSVENHSMERCVNVLHRGHLIPSLSLSEAGDLRLANVWVDQLLALIRRSLRILETDEDAINAAFSWLRESSPTDGDGLG